MRTEPALIVGAIAAALSAAANLVFGGGLDDGLQTAEAISVLAPIGAAFGIRVAVDSPETVEIKEYKASRRRR